MANRKIVQDIIPIKKRSIRSIPLSIPDEEIIEKKSIKKEKEENLKIVEKENTKKHNKTHNSNNKTKILSFILIFVGIAIIAFALSLFYTKAVVTITPVTIPLNINGNFIAKKDSITDSISYQIVTITDEMYDDVPYTEGPLIQTKAKGTITLYNTSGPTPQKVIAGTRLINDKNQVYKTTVSVTIPGQKTAFGKTVPGSVIVGIIAEQNGENYNMLLSDNTNLDLKVIAYKGSDKYKTIYGKLKTDISGGFNGKKKIISVNVEKMTNAELEEKLKNKLIKDISSIIPEGYIMFENANNIEFQKLSTSTLSSNMTSIGVKGTAYGIIFDRKALIDFIARKQIQESLLNTYKIENLDSIAFNILNNKDFSAKKGNTLSFNLKGSIKIVGTFSESDLKNKLAGIKLDQMNSVVKLIPSIKSTKVLLTPFWMRSFPSMKDNIIIEYK